VQAQYVYGAAMDELLAMDRGGQTYYYHDDSLGSIEALTNAAQTIVERTTYDAYGAAQFTDAGFTPTGMISTVGNPFLFTAQRYDPETKLYYYRNRYYNPTTGRFIQRDPIGYSAGSMGLYEYVENNGINLKDPSGFIPGDIYLFEAGDLEGQLITCLEGGGKYSHVLIEIGPAPDGTPRYLNNNRDKGLTEDDERKGRKKPFRGAHILNLQEMRDIYNGRAGKVFRPPKVDVDALNTYAKASSGAGYGFRNPCANALLWLGTFGGCNWDSQRCVCSERTEEALLVSGNCVEEALLVSGHCGPSWWILPAARS
jgi:RHS repeat-associated protein